MLGEQDRYKRRRGWRATLDVVTTVSLLALTLVIAGITLRDRFASQSSAKRPAETVAYSIPLDIENTATRGVKNAPVAILLFSEFECPYCAEAAQQLIPQLERDYLRTNKAVLVWRHYPLPRHASARGAAVAAECARRQERFWELHEWAFTHQQTLQPSAIRATVASLGLDLG